MSIPSREKIEHCRNELLRRYFQASIVEHVAEAIDFRRAVHENLDFLQLGKWLYIPRDWFTDPNTYPDLFFNQIGEGIAFGEKSHIIDAILANEKLKREKVETVSYSKLLEAIKDLISDTGEQMLGPRLVLFAPIEYFVTLHTDWVREHGVRIRPDTLIIGGLMVKSFWSSKYMDYKDFIILERSLCRWIAKPTVESRLQVEILESDKPGKMELKVQTVFNFTILNPEKIRVLQPTRSLQNT